MGIQTFPAPTITVPPALNTSQVFTTSGTFTVPAGVTSVFVRVRGGDGGRGHGRGSGDNTNDARVARSPLGGGCIVNARTYNTPSAWRGLATHHNGRRRAHDGRPAAHALTTSAPSPQPTPPPTPQPPAPSTRP